MVRIRNEKELAYHREYMRKWYATSKGKESRKKTHDKWYYSQKGQSYTQAYYQKPERKEAARRYWLSEKGKQRKRESLKRMRIRCLEVYGNKCVCCGENRYEFLSFDHIDGGGIKHRKETKYGEIFRWLHKNKFPKGFRILCHNCNQSLGAYGYCPHKTEFS